MNSPPDDTTPTHACVCACATDHPPARVARCVQRAVAERVVYATGVGRVPMPVCQTCNSAWATIGRGVLHEPGE